MSSLEIGCRIRLIMTDDPYTRLKSGDMGTITDVTEIPSFGNPDNGIEYPKQRQIWVNWDSGSKLALIEGKDLYEIQGYKKEESK